MALFTYSGSLKQYRRNSTIKLAREIVTWIGWQHLHLGSVPFRAFFLS